MKFEYFLWKPTKDDWMEQSEQDLQNWLQPTKTFGHGLSTHGDSNQTWGFDLCS